MSGFYRGSHRGQRLVIPGTYTPVNSVSLSPSTISVVALATQQMTATVKDAGNNILQNRVVNWASNNTNIATVNAFGVVTGVAAGNCTITATCEGVNANAACTVSAQNVVDAGASSVSATTPVSTGATSSVTVTARRSDNTPLSGQTVTLAVSGTGNSISQPGSTTNGSGVATGSFSSSVAESKTVTATAGGVVITQQPTVVVQAGGASPTFVEDFSEYTSTANMRTNPAGKFTSLLDGSSDNNETFNAALITLDQTQGVNINGFSLTQCMLYSFPIANVQDYQIACNLKLDQDYNEGWFELYAKFSTSFTTAGPAPGNADYKFTAGRTRISGRYMTFCGTFGTGWQFGTPASDEGFNSDVVGFYGNSAYDFGSSLNPWDGLWHRYRYHLKNSSAGGAIFFIDNLRMPSFPMGTINTSGGGAIWSWSLGHNNNKGQSQTMTVRQGRFAAYASDPGWGF